MAFAASSARSVGRHTDRSVLTAIHSRLAALVSIDRSLGRNGLRTNPEAEFRLVAR